MGALILKTLKLVLALSLFPVVVASISAFVDHLELYSRSERSLYLCGFYTYVICFIFLFRWRNAYEIGQSMMAGVFRFMAPLDRYVSYFFSFYLVFLTLLFYLVSSVLGVSQLDRYFIYLMGFATAFHLLCTSAELQEAETDAVKPSYLLKYATVIVGNVCLLVCFLDLTIGSFAFDRFLSNFHSLAQKNYNVAIDFIFNIIGR